MSVSLLEKRLAWRKQLDDGGTAEVDAREAQAAIEKAQRAIDAAIAKNQPAIDSALAVKQSSEHRRTLARYAAENLAGELLDQGLADRIKTLNSELRGLQAERRGLQEKTSRLNLDYWQRKIESHQNAKAKLSDLDALSRAHHLKREREARQRLEEQTEKSRRFRSELVNIEQQTTAIERELADAQERMLEP